jgi:pimeloyl-ACP methyl ester carboxylesterase/predicted glycosyltransferase
MRAIEPAEAEVLTLEGFEIGYETFGDLASLPILLLPTWQIVHSRVWKMQIPWLSRYRYVVTYDSPGNGRSQRTTDPAAFQYDRVVDQGIGLLDHLGIEQIDILGFSRGTRYALAMASRYPERVKSLILIGNGLSPDFEPSESPDFWERRESYKGWEKWNAHYWLKDYEGWLEFFFGQLFNEAHSTKPTDDCIGWGSETTGEILAQTSSRVDIHPEMPAAEIITRVECPVLLIHGAEDQITAIENSQKLAAARPDFEFVTLEGSGHAPMVRDPVRTNLLIEEFLRLPRPKQRGWRRAMTRRKRRALFISSPIGLGHVQRDLAIARELRQLVPDLEIDWLAQPPVTRVLQANGETIHPMSSLLASESAHWEASASQHELHCFYAWREMDEILLANFMVFLDVVRETPYDLWIGDESWEVDYYLHENPELKRAPYVFLTDFLGWVPIDRQNGSREAFLTADYNAEMIEQVERFKRVRDQALYIGEYEDLLPGRFGPGLPYIPEWAKEHFTAVGEYIVNFDPADYENAKAGKERLGYDPSRPLLIVAVGGTAVGQDLLRRTCATWPLIQRERPEAQCLVVAGPRIDPQSLPQGAGMEIRPYVHNLFEHLAVSDLAVVQGGLSTTMELAVNKRPFLYFPLKNHCEQVYHVAHRLDRYRAGQRMDYAETDEETLAEAALDHLGADTSSYRPYATGAAGRAATLLAELL